MLRKEGVHLEGPGGSGGAPGPPGHAVPHLCKVQVHDAGGGGGASAEVVEVQEQELMEVQEQEEVEVQGTWRVLTVQRSTVSCTSCMVDGCRSV